MDFFADCKTEEQVKARYRELVKIHHPDVGGDSKTFIKIQKEYESWTGKQTHTAFQFNQVHRESDQARPFRKYAESSPNYSHEANYHNPYVDVPFDHPLRKELFDLRNQLADYKQQYGTNRVWERSYDPNSPDKQTIRQLQEELRMHNKDMDLFEKAIEKSHKKNDDLNKELDGIYSMGFFKRLYFLFFRENPVRLP